MNRGARLRRSHSLTTPHGTEPVKEALGDKEQGYQEMGVTLRKEETALQRMKRRHKSLDWNHFNYPQQQQEEDGIVSEV